MGILNNKVAIVTGASKGIGKGEAIALAKEGAKVAVLARTYEGEKSVIATATEIEAFGGIALPIQCDVCSIEEIKQAVEMVVKEWGSVDILVNNAQVLYPKHPFEDWTELEMRVSWESGLLASWAFMIACFPYMKKNGGRIINTCSTSGHGNVTGLVGYSCAKEAVRALTRNGAREWAKYGITVNTISPMANSDIVERTYPDEESRQRSLMTHGCVIMRRGDPELDIGRSVVFLCGPDSSLITGCTLSVDGGSAML